MIEADVTALRPRLYGLAYRMLGTPADADDVVQEAFVRWLGADRANIRDAQAWLLRATTNAAVDRLRALQNERKHYTGAWLPEPIVRDAATDPAEHAELAEDVSVALLLVLERLAPDERAAFILHDTFGYRHAEIASMLGRTDEAVRQMLHRARTRLHAERPRFAVDRSAAAAFVDRFVRAFEAADESELRAVLAEDVTQVADGGGVVAVGVNAIVGRERVVRLWLGLRNKRWSEYRLERVGVGGAPGLIALDAGGTARAVISIASDRSGITGLHALLAPEKLTRVLAEYRRIGER